MKINYLISTLSGSILRVTEDIFNDYINQLDYSYPEYEVNTFEHELPSYNLKSKSYFLEIDGKRQVIAQVDTWEDKTK